MALKIEEIHVEGKHGQPISKKSSVLHQEAIWFNDLEEKFPGEEWVGVCQDVLKKIDEGAYTEFVYLLSYDDEDNSQINNHGQAAAFLLMILFNQADKLIESEKKDCLSEVLDEPANIENKWSFREGFAAVSHMLELNEAKPMDFEANIEEIFAWQQKGMDLLKKSKAVGRPIYTVEAALEYRMNTLGNYFKLLAGLGIKNQESQRQFVHYFVETVQYSDDKCDAWEDWLTQVNPFVAASAQGAGKEVFEKIRQTYADFI